MTVCKTTCYTVTGKEDFEKGNDAFNKDTKDYITKWSNYCTDCDGWGGSTSSYDPSAAGVCLSPGYFTEYDPCSECSEKDICPRCGDKTLVFLDIIDEASGLSADHCECTSCDWVEQKTEGMPQDPPEPPECDCFTWEDLSPAGPEESEALDWPGWES